MREKILAHYKANFASSPQKVSEQEIDAIIASDCSCQHCGKSLFGMYDFPNIDGDEVLCEDCYKVEHMFFCPICQDRHEKHTKPEDHLLIISSETVEEYGFGIKPGFYQVLKYPFFRAAVGFGFDRLFEDTIQLIKEVDINSMLKKLQGSPEEISADDCCHDCMMKYTGQTPIVNNYCDKEYGEKRVAFERRVIQDGK